MSFRYIFGTKTGLVTKNSSASTGGAVAGLIVEVAIGVALGTVNVYDGGTAPSVDPVYPDAASALGNVFEILSVDPVL